MTILSRLSGVVLSLIALDSGCVSNYKYFVQDEITMERVIKQGKGLIVAIEGLQPYSDTKCTNLAAKIAEDCNMVLSASSGDWGRHLPIIKKAYDEGNKIALIGFSAGTEEVWNIAKACKKLNIPIDLMVYLDPTHKNNPISSRLAVIPGNVREVMVYIGERSGYWGGRELGINDFENPDTKFKNTIIYNARHLEVPESSIVYNELKERFSIVYNVKRKKK